MTLREIVMPMTLVLCLTTWDFPIVAQSGQNAIHVEGLGAGLLYSINYERRFEGTDGWGVRIGANVLPDVTFTPLHANYLVGSGDHKLDLGLGITAVWGRNEERDLRDAGVSGTVMYRYQPLDKGIVLRVGWSPIYVPVDPEDTFSGLNTIFLFWIGGSVGYRW